MVLLRKLKGSPISRIYPLLLMTKLVVFLIIANISLVMGKGIAQNVSLKAKNISLVDAMKSIKRQSGVAYFLNGKDLANIKLDVDIRNRALPTALNSMFKNKPVDWLIDNETIVIISNPDKVSSSRKRNNIVAKSNLEELNVAPQQRTISGKIMNSQGSGINGVSVSVKGNSISTVTDEQGNFSIIIPNSIDILIISIVGYKTQEYHLEGRNVIQVTLEDSIDEIDDVVVVGFGKQRQISVIGSISTTSPQRLNQPVGNLSTSLAGQMAGIVSAQRTGEPGASSDFWVRGVTTFGAGNRPLVLVDGIERPLDLVNPEDMESISILKDATATAVYGVRGANGVILITTKQGKVSKPEVTLRMESGMLSPTVLPKMANAEQFLNMFNDGYESQFGSKFYSEDIIQKYVNGDDPDIYPNVNWSDVIFKENSANRRLTTNISGGGENIRYYVSAAYYQEDGIFNTTKNAKYDPEIKWDRYNFRANVDMNLFKGNTVSVNLSNQFDIKNGPNNNTIWQYTFQVPHIVSPIFYSTGELALPGDGGVNPYELLNERGDVRRFTNNTQSLVNITQDFSEYFLKGLQFNVKFSWDAASVTTNTRSKIPMAYSQSGRDANGELILIPRVTTQDYLTLSNGNYGERVTYLESSLTYNTTIGDNHRVGGLLLFNRRERFDNFPSNLTNSFPYRNIGLAGRATYSFRDRYFTEFNFGYNGSENFAPDKRFGFFPSAAVGYVISNEKFWRNIYPVVNVLKLKASYGLIGNDQIRGRRFAYNSEMITSTGYTFGEGGDRTLNGISVGYQGNPNVSWETAYKTNFGVEVELFRSLNIKADYFDELRKGIFIQRLSVPSIVGLSVDPFINMGELSNKGFELSAEYNKSFASGFWLSGRGNFTYNRNRLIYDDTPEPLYEYLFTQNKPLYQQFGLVADGLFQSQEEIDSSPKQMFGNVRVGDIKYRDINGDGQVDNNDQIAMGRTHVPEISFGAGMSLGMKNFDMSFLVQGVDNVSYFMGGSSIYGFTGGSALTGNVHEDVALNRWTTENIDAKYPRISISPNSNNNRNSSLRQYDSRYIRLKNAEIGYTLPESISKKLFIEKCRIYAQGVNLLTFSPFKLWDPEIIESQGAQYPNVKTMSLGVNMKF